MRLIRRSQSLGCQQCSLHLSSLFPERAIGSLRSIRAGARTMQRHVFVTEDTDPQLIFQSSLKMCARPDHILIAVVRGAQNALLQSRPDSFPCITKHVRILSEHPGNDMQHPNRELFAQLLCGRVRNAVVHLIDERSNVPALHQGFESLVRLLGQHLRLRPCARIGALDTAYSLLCPIRLDEDLLYFVVVGVAERGNIGRPPWRDIGPVTSLCHGRSSTYRLSHNNSFRRKRDASRRKL